MPQPKPNICRVSRPREQAKSIYNRLSRWYDMISGSSEGKISIIGLEMLKVKENEIILEVGSGTGRAIIDLAQSVGDSGKVYGIDISDGMLQVTHSKVQKAGLSNRTELILGDFIQYPFNPDFFDAIFISFTLELFDTPDIPRVLKKCLTLLKPHGRLCVVSLAKRNKPLTRLYELAHILFPNFLDCRPIYPLQAVREAGFHITTVEELSMWGIAVEIVLAEKMA